MKFTNEFRNKFTKQNSHGAKDWPIFSKEELLTFLSKQPIVDDKIEFTINGRIFRAFLNKNGNVSDIIFWNETPERKIAEMGEYTDDVRECFSDIGSIVINGIAFPNGYGDGVNTVVVRTFTKRPAPHAAYCRAQIYNKAQFFSLQKGATLRIESYDCNEAGEGDACFEGPAEGFVQHGRKVWIIIDKINDKKEM